MLEEKNKCPMCRKGSFKYDSKTEAKRCYNEACGWSDKTEPAIDVPMSFLELCFSRAEPGPKKDKLKEIIDKTIKVNKKYNIPPYCTGKI